MRTDLMSEVDAVVFWILALPAIALFYFAYGLAEEFIRNRRKPTKPSEAKPPIEQAVESESHCQFDWPQAAHGYDTPELFRRDALVHIWENGRAFAEHEENIRAILTNVRERERLQ